MLELSFVRDNLDQVRRKMRERGMADTLGNFEELDRERRKLLGEVERRKAHRNKVPNRLRS